MAYSGAWPRSPRGLWGALRGLLVFSLILQVLLIAPSAYELWRGVLSAEVMEQDPSAILIALSSAGIGIIWFVVFVICVIVTSRITFRMMKNLDALEAPGVRMTPTMAVVWYFVPVASLWMPYKGFKQTWDGTFALSPDPAPSDGAVGPWWLCWIVSNITGTVSLRMSVESGGMSEFGPTNIELYNMSLWVGIASSVFGVLATWLMIAAFGPVAHAQDEIIRARVPTA